MFWFQQEPTLHIISRAELKFSGMEALKISYREDLAVKRFLEVEAN